ncbi:MAG: chromosome segregation protein SMC [Chitinispirillaceae bacterium]|nr:chromosome segregation protein SMC [Chitinispirillaceae bacterium]
MVLKRLQIFGFKSFADKTELIFGEGMTAVIGPNGCGKSNVVDAIRWVFGEQKASQLRSNNMQDVIFSGTQNRHPLNIAEVVLTIKNNRGILPVEFSEVAISRRIYRSGESEYQLNKVPCRLRDIHNLFLDTGIGSSTYTTIENAMINSILSDKAEERRTLFEEAAGIGKYKQRRRESQRQLEKTRQDLLRINDKVQEADRQVRMLARHVEKAKRYKTYYEDLKSLEVGFEHQRYIALAAAVTARRKIIEEAEARRETIRAKIAAAESRIEKMQLFALEKEKDLETASRRVSETNEQVVRIDRDISITQERLNNTRQNVVRFDQDMSALEAQIEEGARVRAQLERGIVEGETLHRQCRERLDGAGDELARFDAQMQERRAAADQLGRDQIEAIDQAGELRNRISTLKSDLSNTMERRAHDQRELQQLEMRIEEYREAINLCRRQLAAADEEHGRLFQSRETLINRIEQEDTRYQKLIEREKRLEAQIDSSRSQRKFLQGLESAYEGYGAGVKELLTRKLPGMRGIIADLISVVDEKAVGLVEKVLGNAVQTVVFDTEEQLRHAVATLTHECVGEACMVSLERLASLAASLPAEQFGAAASLRSMIKVMPQCEAVADNLLGSVFITDNGSQAMDLILRSGTPYRFAGRDGVICNGDGTVIAGTAATEKAGILQRKRQIDKLTDDIAVFEEEYAVILGDKDRCTITRDEAKVALIGVDEKLNQGQRRQQEQQTAIKHYEQEIQNVQGRIAGLHPELAEAQSKIASLEERVIHDEAEDAVLENRREELELTVETARGEVRAMEERRRMLTEQLKNIELETQGLQSRINQDGQDIQRLTHDISLLGERTQAKSEEKRRSIDEIADLGTLHERLKLELQYQCSVRVEQEGKRDEIREAYNAMLMEIEEVRKKMRGDQTEQETLGNSTHDEQIKLTRDEQEQRRIRERIWEVYEVDLETPPATLQPVVEEEQEVQHTIAMLRERIKHVGQVNMAALEDYDAESGRLKEFTAQRDDLQTAVDDLERAIRKLDKEARIRFCATFGEVQKHFSDMFTTLFEGGEAHIALEENADPLEAPIHINVRPAGKKMRGVQLLSGGERALTAISLLFALYLVKPSAYCILDELDAPLDDANIGRFVKVLRKFAEQTQFIVITHNKRTMEAADLLYGVTQYEKGVSTIVSVRFDEAQLKAA